MNPDMARLVDEHRAWMLAGGLATRTIDARIGLLQRLAALFGHLHLVDADTIAGWFAAHPQWSAETRAVYFGHLYGFYAWSVDTGRLDANPMAGLRRPKAPRGLPRPVTEAELRSVLDRAEQPWRTYILLAAYAGLRACEIARLQREDVDEREIRVRSGKGGKAAVLPCHPAIWSAVKDLPPGPIAWRTDGGGPADEHYVSTRTALYFRRQLHMPGVGLHRFRHRFATALLRGGNNIRVVQTLMRHASLNTTARYTAVDEAERASAVAGL